MTEAGDGPVVTADGWDAVVVAGGASRRMGGGDKVVLDVAGRTMLERVLAAVEGAGRTVAVGPRRPTSRDVVWCREEPAGGGPAAAVAAGLVEVRAPVVVIVAADQPLLDAAAVELLLDALGTNEDCVDGAVAVAVDADDRPQWLCSAWRVTALRRAELGPGLSMRRALESLQWGRVRVDPAAAMDCDTPEDLRQVRELAR